MIRLTQSFALVLLMLLALVSCKDKEEVKPADPVAAFVGTFEVQTPDPAKKYTITITKDDDLAGYLDIANFGNFIKKNTVFGRVEGNKLTIPMQSFPIVGGKTLTLHGEGTLDKNTLTLHYEAGGDYDDAWDVVALRK